MAPPDRVPWIVLCETDRRRWGGDLRRAAIFHELATATGAIEAQGWGHESVRESVGAVAGPPFPWRKRPMLASSEFLSEGAVTQVRRSARPVVLDVHDHPIAQAEAFGRSLEPAVRTSLLARMERNLGLFPLLTVPSASFAALAGLDPARTIVAPNGSDTRHVVPQPWLGEPAVGMISGAAEGRGIEALIAAARLIREGEPRLRLLLWLAAGDDPGEAYLARLRADVAEEPWIEIAAVEHADLGAALGRATVLVVPHPANAYMDVAVPVKLLDSMAAGRPVVVTPRTETRRIVEVANAGIVAADDSPAAIAAAIRPLLADAALAGRLGAQARAAAERDFDWGVIGRRLAGEVLARLEAGTLPLNLGARLMAGIVAFVLNDVEHDSRVLREAASLRAAGHDVTIVGRTTEPYAAAPDRTTTPGGVVVVRVPVARGPLRWVLLARRPRAFVAAAGQLARRDPVTFAIGGIAAILLAIPAIVIGVPAALIGFVLGRVPPIADAWRGLSWRLSWALAVRPWAAAAAAAGLQELPGATLFWAHDLRALPAAIAARDARGSGSVVYDAHEVFSEAGEHALRPSWARRQMVGLERALAVRVEALVTVNELLADRLGPGLRIHRVVVARNCPPRWPGPTAADSPLRAAAGVPAAAPLLLYHGGLAPGRGVDVLAACLAEPGLETAHLVFMGSGPSRGHVAALAAANARIHLLPPVDPAILLEWVAGADVVVAPIQPTTLNHRLSSPNKVFEGIAAGVPVVASDLPAIRTVLLADAAGPLGAVADPDDVPAFAAAVRGILELPMEGAQELRERCRRAARDRWNWETESVGLLELAAELDPVGQPEGGPETMAREEPTTPDRPTGPSPRRICFVLGSTGEFDARTMRLATGCAERGHDVSIVARAGNGLPAEDVPGPGIRLIRVDAGSPRSRGEGLPGPLRLLGEARRIVGVMAQVRRQGRALDQLELMPDIVQAMGFLALPVAARLARRSGARLVYDARDLYVESNNIARLPAPLRALFAWQEGRLARAADAVLTVNESCADYLERRYGLPRPVVVMNGQLPWTPPEPAPDHLRAALGLAPERRIALYHGGFMRDRGLLELVEALAPTRMSDVDLVFMGSGPEEARLREAIGSLAARGRMHILPPVPPGDLLAWVAGADVGVMVNQPRTLNERLSTPNKLFECLTAGTPVVSSDFPERRRIIVDGEDGPLGRVCDPADAGSIGAAIRAILDLDSAESRALRARCRLAGRERFGWAGQFARAIEVYGRVTGRPW